MSKDDLEFFYLEANNDYSKEKIVEFFKKREIQIQDIDIDSKHEKTSILVLLSNIKNFLSLHS